MYDLMKRFVMEEEGISALEYAVLAALMLVLIVAGVQLLNPTGLFENAESAIDDAIEAST